MEQEHKQRFKHYHAKCTTTTTSSSSQDDDNDNDIVCQSLSSSSSLEEDLAHCLVMLSSSGNKDEDKQYKKKKKKKKKKGVFECKACKKVFTSYQALGGHRASHKKVKGCFAGKLYDQDNEEIIGNESPMKKKKKKVKNMYECSICYRVFASGQALGGHKRCHWIMPSNTVEVMKLNIDDASVPPLMPWMEKKKKKKKRNIFSDDHEVDCKIKLAKLSDQSSSWLQMGIGSSINYDDT